VDGGQNFFLSSSGESLAHASPRECWEIRRMQDTNQREYMLISIEPPYRVPQGIGYRDVYKVAIASRFKNRSLYPITCWPCHVDVFLVAHDDADPMPEIDPARLRKVAWAMLFRTLDEADAHSKSAK
jgi:hypothetical protein